jgi:hypothetical protein
LLLAGFSTTASATVVAETEPNDSFATAQNLDGQFSTGPDSNVTNGATVPYVTVVSGPAAQNYDFYSFTVGQAGSSGTFDIDFGMPDFDSYLALFDSSQNLLWMTDDAGVDAGSNHGYDSYFNYVFGNAGQYFLRVGACCGNVPYTGDYQLHVSLESPGNSAVPEPSTWAMMLLGFGAAGYSLRRKTPRKLMQVA